MNIFKSKTSMSEEKNTQSVTPSREKLIAELNYRIKSAELTARSARENKDMFLKVLDTVNAAMLENIKNKDIHRDDVRFEVRVVLRDSIMRFFSGANGLEMDSIIIDDIMEFIGSDPEMAERFREKF